MTLFRTISSIIAGYLVFAISSMLLTGVVMSTAGVVQMVLGISGLILIAILVRYLIAFISRKNQMALFIVAGLVVAATGANLFLQLGAEPVWYKLSTLFVLVPGMILLDRVIRKHKSKKDANTLKS